MSELVHSERRFRHAIPERHRRSLDTRVQWLWNQRSGTVQKVFEKSTDILDRTAATMVLQAIFEKNLGASGMKVTQPEVAK